jgi:hypothetical protein
LQPFASGFVRLAVLLALQQMLAVLPGLVRLSQAVQVVPQKTLSDVQGQVHLELAALGLEALLMLTLRPFASAFLVCARLSQAVEVAPQTMLVQFQWEALLMPAYRRFAPSASADPHHPNLSAQSLFVFQSPNPPHTRVLARVRFRLPQLLVFPGKSASNCLAA